jgi:flavin-dependent dehydrogenase
VSGVQVRDRAGDERSISARLVVAADGRGSRVARMAGVRTRTRSHERVFWFAYYRGIELDTHASSQMWFAEPDVALALHNEDGLTVLVYLTPKERQAEWKADPAGNLRRAFAQLPRAPRLDAAEMVGRPIGKADMTNERRPAAAKGMALIGDAARPSDPLWGIGCGWAFQSAEWLVDATAEQLRRGDRPAAGLRRYRAGHLRRLAGHDFLISDYSRVRPMNPIERLMFGASVHDARTAAHFGGFGSRSIGAGRFLAPAPVARAAWGLATRRRAATTRRAGRPGGALARRRPAVGAAARRG